MWFEFFYECCDLFVDFVNFFFVDLSDIVDFFECLFVFYFLVWDEDVGCDDCILFFFEEFVFIGKFVEMFGFVDYIWVVLYEVDELLDFVVCILKGVFCFVLVGIVLDFGEVFILFVFWESY